jgi:hypothetical protein
MFNFSASKSTGPKIKDVIWMTEAAKSICIVDSWKNDPSVVITCWSNETLHHAESLFTNAGRMDEN